MTTFHIITIFPEALDSYLSTSMLKRAREAKKIRVSTYNPRDYTKDKHRKTDDRPYGGGPGMVMLAEPTLKAVKKAVGRKRKVKKLILSPQGEQFDTAYAKRLAKNYDHIVLIAGHYEGIDARVKKALKADEVSIGPYVLTGGELPALVVVDSVTRQIPGVLGNLESLEESRTASPEVYTRPPEIIHEKKKYRVPKILQSGNHAEIEKWKRGLKEKRK